ncbi:MAG: chemotaxis protein CheA [Lachnospiraceae bacterium]|nr:chemotaxis protein CheA [Lachnospiraceae bacterium]
MSEEFNTEGMLDMYLLENGQLLESLQETVLNQKDAECFDEDAINEIFRTMHTIKGSSGIMMFDNVTKIAHKLEDIFYYLRESKPDNVPHLELVSYVLDVADFISAEMDKIRDGNEPDGDPTKMIGKLDDFLKQIKHEITKDDKKELPPENVYVAPNQFYIAPVSSNESRFYQIIITFRPDTQMSNIRAYSAVYALKEIAEDMIYYPEDIVSNENSAEIILRHGFRMLLQAQASQEEIRPMIDTCADIEKIDIREVTSDGFLNSDFLKPIEIDLDSPIEEVERKAAETEQEEEPNKKAKDVAPGDYVIQSKEPGKAKQLNKNKPAKASKQSFISVNVEKMDELMDLIGELVIAEAVVLQNPDLKVPGLELQNFQKAARQLSKISADLQDVIMSMRMMPLTTTFQKMNRIVFDASRKLEKDIELEVIGENTEVDKNIIEHISDPLMHLIRNAVDHGIETPAERAAAGKRDKGKVTLLAKNEGGKVWITVQDNGAGMDRSKILKKARKNGLLGNKNPETMTDKEVYQFITYPGFSTNETVTEFSGRGVGMDVVVKNIQTIGGTLDIDSIPGEGSTMTMKIPLTLAIIDGIVMETAGSYFVVETGIVKSFVNAREDMMIHEPDGEEYIMIREECYPVIRLGEYFSLTNEKIAVEDGMMVLIELEEKTICILVDKLLGEQEIVVKPIPQYIKKVRGLSGCTQLGDGSIALILDPASLIG